MVQSPLSSSDDDDEDDDDNDGGHAHDKDEKVRLCEKFYCCRLDFLFLKCKIRAQM